VIKDFIKALQSMLAEGANVTTPFANYFTSIRGVFDGAQDVYDPSRHQLTPIVNPGKKIRAFYRSSVTTQKNLTIDVGPVLVTFEDSFTGEINSVLSRGSIGKLIGSKLNFDPEDEQHGVLIH
jgi:hypothetical protein